MKKIFAALTVLLCLLTATTVFAKSADEQRAEINALHDRALKNL